MPVRNEGARITRNRTSTENDSDAHRRAKPKAQDVVGSMGASSVFSRKRSGTKSCGSYGPSFAKAIALDSISVRKGEDCGDENDGPDVGHDDRPLWNRVALVDVLFRSATSDTCMREE